MSINKSNINNAGANFIKLDLAMICEEEYCSLKPLDFIVYSILKNQEWLSKQSYENGNSKYVDSNGNIFVKISQEKLAKIIKISRPTLGLSIKRLEEVNLLECVHSGVNNCNKIYVGNPNRSISFGEYVEKIGIELDSDIEDNLPKIKVENVKEKADTPAKESASNKSICNSDNNNSRKFEKVEVELTEVERAINNSSVNIKKADMPKCVDNFKNISLLVNALAELGKNNSHGFKALNSAYNKLSNSSNKDTSNMQINGKQFNEYSDDEIEKLVLEREKAREMEKQKNDPNRIIVNTDGRRYCNGRELV